jgi:cytochrome c-type biogenesis protein CcmE
MSRIDDELEQAVRDGEAAPREKLTASAAPGGRTGSVRKRSASGAGDEASPVVTDAHERKGWGLLAVLLLVAGVVLTLVFTGSQEAVVYSYRVDEVKAKAADLGERQLRVQGSLVSGTLVRRDNPCEYRFMMRKLNEKEGEALEVRYPLCVVPDTFRDVKGVDVEVTAEGRLAEDGHLQASKIFAKCPSKYEMRDNANKMGGQGPQHTAAGAGQSSEFIPARVEASAGVR